MSNLEEIIKKLKDHENRIRALEGGSSRSEERSDRDKKDINYSGATGGIRFLIKSGFLDTKRNQKDIRKKLTDENYHYSSQAVYEALQILSKSNGPLVVLKEKGKKVYVKRK